MDKSDCLDKMNIYCILEYMNALIMILWQTQREKLKNYFPNTNHSSLVLKNISNSLPEHTTFRM